MVLLNIILVATGNQSAINTQSIDGLSQCKTAKHHGSEVNYYSGVVTDYKEWDKANIAEVFISENQKVESLSMELRNIRVKNHCQELYL